MSESKAGQPASNPTPPPPPPLARAEAPAGSAHKPFTAKQQRIWDLTRPVSEGGEGKTRSEAAAILGISAPVVSKTLQACYRKKGIKHKKGEHSVPKVGAEVKKPEIAAAALDALSDPWNESRRKAIERVNLQLKAEGIPDKVSEALVKRLKVKYAGVVYAARELRTAEILEMLGKKIDLCAFYLDDKVLSEASARDIMLGMTALIEKRNLLRGEPTAIVSDHERKKIHELVPALLAEAQRRGLTVQGQVTEKTVESLGPAA